MIYVDANATYPVQPSHYDEVARVLKEVDGNPSSIHASGRNAKIALEDSRAEVASMFGCRNSAITFTSGATEGNNLVIQGVINKIKSGGVLPNIIISDTEHSAVKEPSKNLANRELCELRIAPVGKDGVVDVEGLLDLVDSHTALVCVMHVNNEVGSINPVKEIAERIKQINSDTHVHVDAVQMFGKRDLTWYADSFIDTAVATAHKIGGYKGVGALYLKLGIKLVPLQTGGGQERARRPGTENIPGIISFGIRCKELRNKESDWLASANKQATEWICELKKIDGVQFHADLSNPEKWIGNTVNFHIDGIAGDDILLNFDLAGIQASSGSACSSGVSRPSHVLKAMGHNDWVGLNSVRTSFVACGHVGDVTEMIRVLKETITRVQSPDAANVHERL
jgi:cysteine desulfurase